MLYNYVLKMHVGKPALPVKDIGDKVFRGELVAKSAGGVSANIHSAVTGTVRDISNDSITIEAFKSQSKEFKKIKRTSSIAESAFEAGIVGSGGAGFPTHIKLSTEIKGGVVIANCAECEPGFKHNLYFIKKYPRTLVKGIKYAMESTKASNGVIGIKDMHEETIEILENTLRNESSISILKLKDIYPVGEERALIYAHFGEWLSPKELPCLANYVIFNVETLKNIVNAVELQKPVIDKDFTIVGDFIETNEHSIVCEDVFIGTPIEELVKSRNLTAKYKVGEIVIGGPYTGKSFPIDKAFVTKMSGGVIYTIELPIYQDKVGLLVCACGANEERLKDIADKMGSEVVEVAFCKNIDLDTKKCQTPGYCPGQALAVMKLKKKEAKRIIIANCSDCSNTVMCIAPSLGLGVYHSTDHIFRTIGMKLTRRIKL